MRRLLLVAAILLAASTSLAQTQVVTAGGSSGAAGLPLTGGTLSGALAFSGAANPGFAPNSLTTTQRDALGVVANGTTIFNTTTARTEYYLVGTGWVQHVRLIGDTMTGALNAAAAGFGFNGSKLLAGGANVVQQSNLANAQAFRLYNTTDNDATPVNAEWFSADWTTTANTLTLGVKALGTGTNRNLNIASGPGGALITFMTGASATWQINSSGNLIGSADISRDLGTSNNHIRDAYFGRSIVQSVGTQITAAATITPTTPIVHVTGATPIATITVPAGMATAGNGGEIIIIPDSAFTWTAGGNIAITGTAVVSHPIHFVWDNTAAKWFPQ